LRIRGGRKKHRYQRFRRRTITTKTTTAVTITITSTSFGPIKTAAIIILSPCLFSLLAVCKIEVRHILFKKISFLFFLNNQIAACLAIIYCLKRKIKRQFFLFKVCLTSILQKTYSVCIRQSLVLQTFPLVETFIVIFAEKQGNTSDKRAFFRLYCSVENIRPGLVIASEAKQSQK